MPFYEYRCQACGEELEVLQKISDPVLVDCPACGKPELKKKISAAAFRLKGGGWYETDFKDRNKRNVAESGDGKTNGGDKSSGKTDDKSAGKQGAEPGKDKKKTGKPAASSSSASQSD